MDSHQRSLLIKNISGRIDNGPYPIEVKVPNLPSGVYGIDTNALFSKLDENKRERHTTLVVAASDEYSRNARKSDVIVAFIQSLGETIRVDFASDCIIISVKKMPASVMKRKKTEICQAYESVLKHCATNYFLV